MTRITFRSKSPLPENLDLVKQLNLNSRIAKCHLYARYKNEYNCDSLYAYTSYESYRQSNESIDLVKHAKVLVIIEQPDGQPIFQVLVRGIHEYHNGEWKWFGAKKNK